MSTTTSAGQPDRRPDTPPPQRYRGRLIAVGTRHGKKHQFEVPFREVLGAALLTPPDLDTDRFGTFSGERPRRGPAVEAAKAKAHLAIAATGLPLALASEASYGTLPGSGIAGHEEILLFCDAELGIEIVEGHRVAGLPAPAATVAPGQDPPGRLLAGLPGQALIVRPARPHPGDPDTGIENGSGIEKGTGIEKGIVTAAAARAAIAAAAAVSADGRAVVEPDLRAHHNPSRRHVLRLLAERLAHRLATDCPACGTPGFGRVDVEPGLPCRVCATPTPEPDVWIQGCCACGEIRRQPAAVTADPARCPSCNP